MTSEVTPTAGGDISKDQIAFEMGREHEQARIVAILERRREEGRNAREFPVAILLTDLLSEIRSTK